MIKLQQSLKYLPQILIALISFKWIDFYRKWIVMSDRIIVIIHQDHVGLGSGALLDHSQVLDEVAIDLFAAISIKTLLDYSLNVQSIQDCIRVLLFSSSVHINCEYLTCSQQKLICVRSCLNIHILSITLLKRN